MWRIEKAARISACWGLCDRAVVKANAFANRMSTFSFSCSWCVSWTRLWDRETHSTLPGKCVFTQVLFPVPGGPKRIHTLIESPMLTRLWSSTVRVRFSDFLCPRHCSEVKVFRSGLPWQVGVYLCISLGESFG